MNLVGDVWVLPRWWLPGASKSPDPDHGRGSISRRRFGRSAFGETLDVSI